MRRRVWSEDVSPKTLRDPAVIRLLARYGLEVLVAVRPRTQRDVAPSLAALRDAGVRVGLWPMLEDAEGRWASAANMKTFVHFAANLLDDRSVAKSELAIDLEPSFERMRRLLLHRAGSVRTLFMDRASEGVFDDATKRLAALADKAREAGIEVSAAVVPLVCFGRTWDALLGTPISEVGWDHLSAMLYTSIIEGWSRGFVGRRDAEALLAEGCLRARERFGERAGTSLGAVGTGAFGNEPIYRSPAELARDVAIARKAGIDDLTLFDLGGVLARPPAEAWLDAFTKTEPAEELPVATLRARALLGALRAAGKGLGAIARVAG